MIFGDRLLATKVILLWWLIQASWVSAGEDWPRWRGVRGDGTWDGPAELKEGTFPGADLQVVWKVRLGAGYSGVTVSAGRVYTMDRVTEKGVGYEQVRCLDAETGKEWWRHAYEAPYGDLEYGSGPRASVTIHEGRAYAFGAVGHAHCFDAVSGDLVWKHDTVKELGAVYNTWGFSSSPLIYGDFVILQLGIPGGGGYVAFDRLTGRECWRGGDDPAGYATPVVFRIDEEGEGADQLVCWTPEHIRGVSPRDGQPLWSHPFKVKYGVSIATPVVRENVVLVNEYWAGSKALELRREGEGIEARLLWERADVCGLMAQPLYREGHVYLLDKDRGLCCFRLRTGEVLWEDKEHRVTPAGRNPQATMVQLLGTDRALALNANGELLHLELRPQGYRELARAQILGKTWAHPAYAGRRIYARSDRSLVCVDLLQASSP